jgi:hypothetical protein
VPIATTARRVGRPAMPAASDWSDVAMPITPDACDASAFTDTVACLYAIRSHDPRASRRGPASNTLHHGDTAGGPCGIGAVEESEHDAMPDRELTGAAVSGGPKQAQLWFDALSAGVKSENDCTLAVARESAGA